MQVVRTRPTGRPLVLPFITCCRARKAGLVDFIRDFRFAARRLARAPGVSLVVILTLAVGVGANTAIFSFVNGVLLRPLPYPASDRLVMVCETNAERMGNWCGASPGNMRDWAEMSRSLESIGLARTWSFGIRMEGKMVNVGGGVATPGVFKALRVQPAAGRLFMPEDLLPGRENVLLISHKFWMTHLGGRADAVGQRLLVDGKSHEIIGILPARFEMPLHLANVEMWIPLWPERVGWRHWRGLSAFGRLADGASVESANSELQTIREQLARQYPEDNTPYGVAVESLKGRIVQPVRPALLMFMGAVGLVLLIACANVANLLLARAFSQEKERAVRLALGASRFRLVRLSLTEGIVLALAGGTLGVLLAVWIVDLFIALAPASFPRIDGVRVNAPVMIFSLGVAVLTGVICGLLPGLTARDANLQETLRAGRGSGEGRGGNRTRNALVVVEIALAFLLLIGAGLLTRSFANLLNWQPGFDTTHLVTIPAFSSQGKYPKGEQVGAAFARAVEELRAVPGVVAAGSGSAVPLAGGDGDQEFHIVGQPELPAGQRPTADWFDADDQYFQTLGIGLVRGRYFTPADRIGAPDVAIINETMANRYWPGQDPIGQHVEMLLTKHKLEIVGVVRDVKPFRPEEQTKAQIYWPFAQSPRWGIQFIVRTSTDVASAIPMLRARLEQFDPDMDLGRIRTMEQHIDRQLVNPRFNMTLLVIFAAIALVTAAVGIYGVLAFAVVRRTQEIGVRMALGAHRGDIFRMVIAHALKLALIGLAIGFGGALWLTRFLKGLLAGIPPNDPVTFAATAALFLAIAMLACYIPARRATGVDPIVVLRYE